MGQMFNAATRENLYLRMVLDGPPGSGKTHTGLRFAFAMTGAQPPGGPRKIAVIDTEHRSASKYQGETHDGITWDFDTCQLENFAPTTYTQVIREAARQGYELLFIDSLSHAWAGIGGALEQVDKKGGNSFTNGWREVTPMHNELVNALLAFPGHLIATMRTKVEYVVELDEKTKKSVPKKVGMRPIQREGMEYEFDVVADMDQEHVLKVSKTRCSAIDGMSIVKPTGLFMTPVKEWLGRGIRSPQPSFSMAAPEAAPTDNGPYFVRDNDPAQPFLIEQIVAKAKELGMPKEVFKRGLQRRGATKAAELTDKAAREFLNVLELIERDRGVKEVFH